MRSEIRRTTLEKTLEEQDTLSQAEQPEIKKAMEMQAEAEHRRVKETSRARSARHQESNQIATVLNSIHQFKIPAHRLDRSGTAKEINKPVSDGINKDREIQRSERLQQIRS